MPLDLEKLAIERWEGVDFDGTLAHYNGFKGKAVLGEPIPRMVKQVKEMLQSGLKVKIFTARASAPESVTAIKAWCKQHLGQELEVTNVKDYGCIRIWDDRAVGIIENTGKRADGAK